MARPIDGTSAWGVERTELQRAHASVPGRLIVQTLFDIPVGLHSGRHSHRGEEGDPFLISPDTVHNARNIGTVETRMLSTYFIDDTKPLVTTY